MNTGQAWIEGPAIKEQPEQLRLWEQRRDDWIAELDGLREDLEAGADDEVRAVIENDIVKVEQTLGIIDQLLEKTGR